MAGSSVCVASYAYSNAQVAVFSPCVICAAPASASSVLLPMRKTSDKRRTASSTSGKEAREESMEMLGISDELR